MRNAERILSILRERGSRHQPVERLYRQLFNPDFLLHAYGKLYRNAGAMTAGSTDETVDGMTLAKVQRIVSLLRQQQYLWTPVRRTEIPKANGKTRPLGIPTWSDKLLQEALRVLLEACYEPKFSDFSHGFRPDRSCHTALRQVHRHWRGTVWFIEGDIRGCFDNIDHSILLKILARDIHDGRFHWLIKGLLKAGYLLDRRWHNTRRGTPQGGIVSPLLANIYLNELDGFVEKSLLPEYTRGKRRRTNPEYNRLTRQITTAFQRGRTSEAKQLIRQRRKLPSRDVFDPGFRRLRYVRYADDFLLGLIGTKAEAIWIRDRLETFLRGDLKLELSLEKTLVTHASTGSAKFLGYEVSIAKQNNHLSSSGRRSINGEVSLRVPRKVVLDIRNRYCRRGKPMHRAELLNESDYTIIQRFQSVLRGLYNYFCMGLNVSRRMATIKWILQTSLVKTLANKHRCSVRQIYRRYGTVTVGGYKVLQVVIKRPERDPLIATFGGLPLIRRIEGFGCGLLDSESDWWKPGGLRSEVVQRLLASKCELCGANGPVQMHHIRKLSDLSKPGRRPKKTWEIAMSALRRKSLAVCETCHQAIHSGRHDGITTRQTYWRAE